MTAPSRIANRSPGSWAPMTQKVGRGGRTFPRPSFPVEGAGKTACVPSGGHSTSNARNARISDIMTSQAILQWRSVGVDIDREDQDQ
jgi:hypothetical protein